MKDYSQNGEGRIIANYFGDFVGTVLDVGANDGVLLSNSRALVEAGWKAVLVEPAEVAFSKLMGNTLHLGEGAINFYRHPDGSPVMNVSRGGVFCVNAAITTADGPLTFYSSGTHLKKGDTDLLSTTHPEELARWKKSGEQFTKTVVRGITFATLLRECGLELHSQVNKGPMPNNAARFDFISIDAEGADLDILRQIPLDLVGCRLLCVEVNQRGDAEFTEYAKRHGMRLMWACYENRIYCK